MRRNSVLDELQVSAEINVTPMIDVMLVLLIIFMVVTPAMILPATLPTARRADTQRDRHPTLVVDRTGAYALENAGRGRRVSPAELESTLRAAYAGHPEDHVMYLKADHQAPYAHVLTAIDAARGAGVRRVGAITERDARQR